MVIIMTSAVVLLVIAAPFWIPVVLILSLMFDLKEWAAKKSVDKLPVK